MAKAGAGEALRLKSLAEKNYPTSLSSALKYARRAERLCPDLDGVSQLVTTLEVLHDHRLSADWYKILQLRPFSHPNTISKQYKKLALLLHPANNPSPGSDLAFEAIGLAFLTLSDKVRRQKYDMDLRIKLNSQQTFWTACSTCRLYHQFHRRYLGQRLECPGCNKSFSASEVSAPKHGNVDDDVARVRVSSRAAARDVAFPDKKTKRLSSNERSASSTVKGKAKDRNLDDDDEVRIASRTRASSRVRATPKKSKVPSSNEGGTSSSRKGIIKRLNVDDGGDDDDDDDEEEEEEEEAEEERSRGSTRDRVRVKASSDKKIKRQSSSNSKGRIKGRNVGNGDDECELDVEVDVDDQDDVLLLNWLPPEKKNSQKRKINDLAKSGAKKAERGREKTLAQMQLEMKKKLESKKVKKEKEDKEKAIESVSTDLNSMSVEDGDFYDFDEDRVERSFKKGQVWAVYDDDDGMPRHYGLIDDVVSVNPFLLKMSWLDLQNHGDDALISWEKMGFHVSCGRFKVGRKVDIDSVNCFSHLVECERAAREVYRIYPKKGSVWALYTDEAANGECGSSTCRDRRCYEIVAFLTSYSEMHGLSMAYLEKVEGFKTIFRRREIGCHAIRWLEKDDVRLFSHQIPARKISGEEASDLPKDCWELDPASLPSDLLRIDCVR